MAKYYGRIGFVVTIETPAGSGIWREQAIEKYYRGDLIRVSYNWESRQAVTDDITISNQISIVADNFVMENLGYMRYAEFKGTMFKITNVEVSRPRITLSLGGVYNGQQAQSATNP